jgi:hypothetical protein
MFRVQGRQNVHSSLNLSMVAKSQVRLAEYVTIRNWNASDDDELRRNFVMYELKMWSIISSGQDSVVEILLGP